MIELLLLWLVCAVALLGAVCAALVSIVAFGLWCVVAAFEALTAKGEPCTPLDYTVDAPAGLRTPEADAFAARDFVRINRWN